MSATLPAAADTLLTDFDRAFDEEIRHQVGASETGESDEQLATVKLAPTAWAFVHDREGFIVVAEGARRAGKSTAALARILRVASEVAPEYLPVKVACVRDTWVNLARSVHETIRQGAARGWWDVEWASQDTECVLNHGAVHFYFFGMDRPADANKFQSFECGILWVEEPAPAADIASGIPVEVLAMGISSLSQAGVPNGCILSMNPPDSSHWTVELLDALDSGQADVRVTRPDEAPIRVKRYWFPPDENKHIPKGYHARLRAVLEAAGRPDLVQRLVEGQRGSVTLGIAVTPDFVSIQHVAERGVPMNARWPAYRRWDFGGTPSVVFAQQAPSGHLFVSGALVTPPDTVMGIEQFAVQIVVPWMARFRITTKPTRDGQREIPYFRFHDGGDPAGRSAEGSNSERSAALAIEALFGTTFNPSPPDWPSRRHSMAFVLRQMIGKTRLVQLDPDETKPLQRSLSGAWHYHKTPSGIVSDRPVKDHPWSDVGDCFGYLCADLYPVADTIERMVRGTDKPSAAEHVGQLLPWWGR